MYLRNKSIILSILMSVSFGVLKGQSCRNDIESLKASLAALILTEQQLDFTDCSSFITARDKSVAIINKLLGCNDIKSIHTEINGLKDALESIPFDGSKRSMSEPSRTAYYIFVTARQSLGNTLLHYETNLITSKLQKDINTIVDNAERDIKDAIKPLTSISKTVNKKTKHLTDSLGDSLVVYIDTTRVRLESQIEGIGKRLQKIENQFESSPLYTGINWFTQNGLGFSVHYHITPEEELSPLAGITLLYQWRPSQEQDTAHNDFGITFSGGLSLMLSENNRLGFMTDVAIINSEVKMGGRLMTYNQHFAVGIGYNEYMGADITLMIRFYDPRKKGVNMRRR